MRLRSLRPTGVLYQFSKKGNELEGSALACHMTRTLMVWAPAPSGRPRGCKKHVGTTARCKPGLRGPARSTFSGSSPPDSPRVVGHPVWCEFALAKVQKS